MKKINNKLFQSTGISLLEVLIALAITGVVVTAIMRLYITQHKNYITQDSISTVQQNARASIDELTRQIRMAGRSLPVTAPIIQASNSNPDTISIMYSSNNCRTTISAPMPTKSSELKCTGDLSCFTSGDHVYIYDPSANKGEWFEITHVQTSPAHIQHNKDLFSHLYDVNSMVISAELMKFYIDDQTDPDHPNLMVQYKDGTSHVYAEDIVDLQFEYRLSSGVVVLTPLASKDIREVIIKVTARTSTPDYENPKEPYKLRTYSSSVNLRNIGA